MRFKGYDFIVRTTCKKTGTVYLSYKLFRKGCRARLVKKGDDVRDVRSIVDETGAKSKWDKFWLYFKRVWMVRYDVSLWNFSEMVRVGVEISNRTNNPLKKYNRDFGERFKVAHPSLFVFLDDTKSESARYLRLIYDIKMNAQLAPVYAEPVTVKIPQSYHDFK